LLVSFWAEAKVEKVAAATKSEVNSMTEAALTECINV
jgi:hypothetical protein